MVNRSYKDIKKSLIVTTSDFQKTNYLKTNLLKQIKKISFTGLSPYNLLIDVANLRSLSVSAKFSELKIYLLKEKSEKKRRKTCASLSFVIYTLQNYIIPPIPGAPIGIWGFSSGLSTMRHSVVRNMPAMDAAFSRATRATFAGSMTPALRISS